MSLPPSSVIAKRASRLSIGAYPVSPVIAITNLALDDSEEDIDIQPQLPEPLPMEPGVRLSFAVFGLGSLMPWNAMITAMPYFLARISGSPYASSFPSWLSVTWTFVGLISLACATWTAQEIIPATRIILPLVLNTLLIAFLAIIPRLSLSPTAFFAVILANGALQAASGSWFKIAVAALASVFGPDAIAAFMTGGALVAVGVSLLKLVTAHASLASEYPGAYKPHLALGVHPLNLLNSPSDADRTASTIIYFSVSAALIGSGIVAYAYLYPQIPHDVRKELSQPEDEHSDIESTPTEVDYLLGRVSGTPIPVFSPSIWIVARKNAYYNIAVFYVFVVTMAVFPAITTSILSVNSSDESIIFNPLIFSALHFLNFNFADLVGRALVSFKPISSTSNTRLLLYSLARTIFIPLFLLCNIQHKPKFGSLAVDSSKPFFNSDIAYMLILFAFGVTNGHASTLVLMAAPSKVMNPMLELYESKTAARIAQFSLAGGLVVGSAASFGLRAIQCRCNPFLD
ncbi:equilibrative nucleoside transporter [Rhizoctonia solani 123E]|uniref:Equilibrative nucleoside transporter n=1 Tax=Rhizoctonia solani 123E TaxID=1423351 RepID=A0A074S996_9AGAM|nr:equilibrative nucleoside transporter [Rhizoctonia solani 123E]